MPRTTLLNHCHMPRTTPEHRITMLSYTKNHLWNWYRQPEFSTPEVLTFPPSDHHLNLRSLDLATRQPRPPFLMRRLPLDARCLESSWGLATLFDTWEHNFIFPIRHVSGETILF
ncbi:hypothetical protein AVEN_88590-1 [Araneus ventricosus]|uniref:Uncharacterized protein n=1 Tax=Araneus ventricosus TaxID=182803 RepID=A0A4Y2X7J0_ARAVE|nr:hypothetical protein AVEN_88590-1 [Araneus ventricosus]